MSNTFFIYGANGYTGEQITRYAVECGLKPIIAGRNAIMVEELAKKHPLVDRVFALADCAAAHRRMDQADQFGKIVRTIA